MTSPTSVGSVSIEVLAEAKGLAKNIRKDIEAALKGLNVGKQVRDSVGRVRVPIEVDSADLGAQLQGRRIPVELEPNTAAFTAALQKTLRDRKVKVDVDVDTGSIAKLVGGAGGFLKGFGTILPSLGGLSSRIADVGGAMQKLAGTSAQAGGAMVGAFTSATGPAGMVVGALVAVAGAAALAGAAIVGAVTIAIPAVVALSGLLASLPAAFAGIGAAAGTLALGFKGISEAFEPASGGGGGAGGAAVNQARQVAAASRQVVAARRGIVAANRQVVASERGLTAAQRGVESANRSLVAAEQRVAEAQQRALLAQKAISKARSDATEDIEDLNRSLRGAAISEAEATQAIVDAEFALNDAKLGGDLKEIARTQNAYDRAVLSLEEAKDTTQDLTAATADANTKGVEGSDKVQQALQDHVDALGGVKDAQQGVLDAQNGVLDAADSLASAQDGVRAALDGVKSAAESLASAQDGLAQAQQKVASGSAGMAKEVTKLAPAAQRFVDAIKSLKPAFESLRLDVQQRLFQGLDKTVTRLGEAWIPALRTTLGSYADTFNNFFKNLGASISTPKFITDMQAGAEGFRQLLDKLGAAITSKLVPAFGALSKAAGPFLSRLGDELAGIVTKFSDWVLAGERSGGLTTFFDKAAEAMHDLFETGTQVGRIIGSVISIITGSQAGAGTMSPLDSFNAALKRLADWLANPENQAKVQSFIAGIESAVNKVFSAIQTVSGWVDTISGWGDKFEEFKTRVGGIFDEVVAYFEGVPDRVGGYLQALPDRVSGIFSTMSRRAGEIVGYGLGVVARFFYDLPGKIWGFIKSIPDRISGLWNNVVAIAKSLPSRFQTAIDGLRNLPARIGNFFSGLPNSLWNAGQDAIRGLWNGITSMGNWLRDKVYNFASGVISGFKAGFNSNSPSKRMADEVGVTLPQGISVGILAGRRDLLQDVNKMADDVAAAAMLPALSSPALDLGADMDAAISRSLSVAGKQQVTVRWEDGATADPVLRAFRDMIRINFNGDVQAAFG